MSEDPFSERLLEMGGGSLAQHDEFDPLGEQVEEHQ
jgi:hypothetical protein